MVDLVTLTSWFSGDVPEEAVQVAAGLGTIQRTADDVGSIHRELLDMAASNSAHQTEMERVVASLGLDATVQVTGDVGTVTVLGAHITINTKAIG